MQSGGMAALLEKVEGFPLTTRTLFHFVVV